VPAPGLKSSEAHPRTDSQGGNRIAFNITKNTNLYQAGFDDSVVRVLLLPRKSVTAATT
jgi:hypothetical protein